MDVHIALDDDLRGHLLPRLQRRLRIPGYSTRQSRTGAFEGYSNSSGCRPSAMITPAARSAWKKTEPLNPTEQPPPVPQ
jgi:hypothetical protein